MKFVILETFKDNFNAFLKNNSLYLAIGLVGAIAIVALVIILKKKK